MRGTLGVSSTLQLETDAAPFALDVSVDLPTLQIDGDSSTYELTLGAKYDDAGVLEASAGLQVNDDLDFDATLRGTS